MFRQLGPAYRPLLEKHNELLRAVWARHGGVEVKTVGDSFVVAFAVGGRGAGGRRGGAARDHEPPVAGECGAEDTGGSPCGDGVPAWGRLHRARAPPGLACVVGATNGGTVLVTEETVLMAGDDSDVAAKRCRRVPTPRLRSAGRALRRGERRCGARATRRRARGARAKVTTSWLPLTTFVGREDALAELTSRVAPGRLLTIVGPGGMGKTRLAVELGLRVADAWSDGVWIADLSKVDERTIGRRRGGRLPRCARRRTRRSFVDPRAPRVALGVAHPRQLRARAAGCCSSGVRHPQRASEHRDPRDESPAARTCRRGGLAHRLASDGRRLGEAVRRPRPLSRPRLLALR